MLNVTFVLVTLGCMSRAQSGLRNGSAKKQEKAGQNSLDPLAFLAGFVDISSKPFFSMWLKKKKLSSWLFMHGLEELYC